MLPDAAPTADAGWRASTAGDACSTSALTWWPESRCGRWSAEPRDRRRGSTSCAGPPTAPDRRRHVLDPDALVLATGAHDRMLPFPGWELPGVFTAGAAQALAKGERVAVGDRVLVAGTGPFLLPVAASLLEAGPGGGRTGGQPRRAPSSKAGDCRHGRQSRRTRRVRRHAGPAPGPVPDWAAPSSRPAATAGSRRSSPPGCARTGRWCPAPNGPTRSTRSASATASPRSSNCAVAAGCAARRDGFVRVDDDQRTSAPACTPPARSPASAALPPPRGRRRRRVWPPPAGTRRAADTPHAPRPGPRVRAPARRGPPDRRRLARAGCAPTRSSAAARRPPTARLTRPPPTRHAGPARAQARHPRRARPVPGPDLRAHRRRTLRAAPNATTGRSPSRSGSANSPTRRRAAEPMSTREHSARRGRRGHRAALPARRRGARPGWPSTTTGTPSTAAGWSTTAAAASGPNGSLGEYSSLTDEERRRVARTAIEAVGGDGIVVVGVHGVGSHQARHWAEAAAEDGARRCALPAADDVPRQPRRGAGALRGGRRPSACR